MHEQLQTREDLAKEAVTVMVHGLRVAKKLAIGYALVKGTHGSLMDDLDAVWSSDSSSESGESDVGMDMTRSVQPNSQKQQIQTDHLGRDRPVGGSHHGLAAEGDLWDGLDLLDAACASADTRYGHVYNIFS